MGVCWVRSVKLASKKNLGPGLTHTRKRCSRATKLRSMRTRSLFLGTPDDTWVIFDAQLCGDCQSQNSSVLTSNTIIRTFLLPNSKKVFARYQTPSDEKTFLIFGHPRTTQPKLAELFSSYCTPSEEGEEQQKPPSSTHPSTLNQRSHSPERRTHTHTH